MRCALQVSAEKWNSRVGEISISHSPSPAGATGPAPDRAGRSGAAAGGTGRLAVNEVLLLVDDEPSLLQELMAHRYEGELPGTALLLGDRPDAGYPGRPGAAAQRPGDHHPAARPHPAAARAGWRGNGTADGVPVRAEVGLRGAVEQVGIAPFQATR